MTVNIDLDACPTCGQALLTPPVPCDAIKPGSLADVLPLRCILLRGHGERRHEAPLPGWDTTVTWAAES